MLIFGQSVPEHESKPNQLDLIQDIHPIVERLEPWMDGPTCIIYPRFQARNRLPGANAHVDQEIGGTEADRPINYQALGKCDFHRHPEGNQRCPQKVRCQMAQNLG